MTGQGIPNPPRAIRKISPKEFDSLFNGTDIGSNHTFHRVSFADDDIRLENRVFRYCTFNECDFIGKHIRKVLFDSCDLRYAQFGATEIVESSYTHCQMNFTNFDVAVIRRTSFKYNDLYGVSMRNIRVRHSWFNFCRMSCGNLDLGEFTDTFFNNIQVSLDDFSDSKFDVIPGEIALEILWSKASTALAFEQMDFVRSMGIRNGKLIFPVVLKETAHLRSWADEILKGYMLYGKE